MIIGRTPEDLFFKIILSFLEDHWYTPDWIISLKLLMLSLILTIANVYIIKWWQTQVCYLCFFCTLNNRARCLSFNLTYVGVIICLGETGNFSELEPSVVVFSRFLSEGNKFYLNRINYIGLHILLSTFLVQSAQKHVSRKVLSLPHIHI